MKPITKTSTVEEIAAIISQLLSDNEISAVLSGGAVVSIYSNNEYESKDLDFVSANEIKKIEHVLKKIGFTKTKDKYFKHSETSFFVEFPSAPLAVGDHIIKKWSQRKTEFGTIQILSPTQCVMDRLAGYFYWNDRQNLGQANL